MDRIRIAVAGAGQFGRNHLRNLREMPGAELVAAVDTDIERARAAGAEFGCGGYGDIREVIGRVDAAVVAVPTSQHASVGCQLLEAGIDCLVEKPIAVTDAEAEQLIATAKRHGRVLQGGHLEQFNPVIGELKKLVTTQLFFEIHRMSMFSPRSLDVDVVLDLMIHDLDIVLSLVKAPLEEVRAAGVSILSPKVDIANVRLSFAGGCVANLTASRVSTEKVRKLRLFQPHMYISLDFAKQELAAYSVSETREIGFALPKVEKGESLRRELESFLECVRRRTEPAVTGEQAATSLRVAREILDKIDEHSRIVARSLGAAGKPVEIQPEH